MGDNGGSGDNPLVRLGELGQSAWLDQLRREWIHGGQLEQWIADDGLRGITSNPSIFQAAIGDSEAYAGQLSELAGRGLTTAEIYDALTLHDIRDACDIFRPLYDASAGRDGYVSHEVSPDLAYDTRATLEEARRLWAAVDRPNVMIKIPATEQGLPAIEQALTEGVNVNITLMFSLVHYEAVAEAYLAALEARVRDGLPVDRLASVASFFVSRVDTYVDRLIDHRIERGSSEDGDATGPAPEALRDLRGRAAVANAKRAYRRFGEIFGAGRFAALEAKGAMAQRLLWASTSTKDPDYSDVKYVDELIGPQTVNTLPLKTLEAFRDHGTARHTLESGLDEADAAVGRLAALGIDLDEVGQSLSREGVEKFRQSLQGVLETVERKRRGAVEHSLETV